jgi:hypothetical protein
VAEGATGVTVAAVPLGAEIVSMGGPAPARQRLLFRFVLYYWRHTKERGTVAIAFDLRGAGGAKLPLGEVKP